MNKKIIYPFILCMFLCFLSLSGHTTAVYGAEKGSNVIRVGFPIQQGLTMVGEQGEYTGYTYDYLMEISQYTGWKYEIIPFEGDGNEQVLTALDMLIDGEIDLLGGLYYDESLTETLAYPGYSYGTNYAGIFVPEDSTLTESTMYNAGTIRVGVYNKKLNQNQKLEQYAQMNGLKIEQVIVDNSEVYRNLIRDGKADALLSTDLAVYDHEGMRAIAHFSPSSFFFATKKGNVDIIRQLDYAVTAIDKVNPNFGVQLYNKYFTKSSSSLYITPEETQFLEEHGVFEVLMYDNKPPFQYIDKKTGELSGVTVEILDYISNGSGIMLHYNTVSTYEEYIRAVEEGKADIAADAILNYQDLENMDIALTLPYHSLPLYLVSREGNAYQANSTYAVPYYLKNVVPASEYAVYFDTVEECMRAVQKKKVDYCYVDEFCSQYLFNSDTYSDLKYINQPDSMTQRACLGVRNTTDFALLSVFNKCITFIPQDKVEEIIYRNTYVLQDHSLKTFLQANKVVILIAVMVIMGVIFILYIYAKNKEQRRIAFENMRYDALSSMANEYFYEYYILKDVLVLSDKCADYFSCTPQLEKFSKRLSETPSDERTGIWAFGDYVYSIKEGSCEIQCRLNDGRQQWFKIVSSVIYNRKKQIYAVGKITNIQEIKTRQLDLERTAARDGLTGIYNIATAKKLIHERLEIGENSAATRALMILDIDDFKQVNDKYGHYSGDEMLQRVAEVMKDIFYPNIVGRLGGDEFIIYTENLDLPEITERCGILRQSLIEQNMNFLGKAFTVSIGISLVGKNQTFDELYKEADKALYQTKADAKDGYSVFDKGKTDQIR